MTKLKLNGKYYLTKDGDTFTKEVKVLAIDEQEDNVILEWDKKEKTNHKISDIEIEYNILPIPYNSGIYLGK